MLKKILGLAAASLLTSASASFAYPISPVTLWELVEQADLIVVARVVSVWELEVDEEKPSWYSSMAHLAVVETWKGERVTDLAVHYPGNLLCPAPPVYAMGELV